LFDDCFADAGTIGPVQIEAMAAESSFEGRFVIAYMSAMYLAKCRL